ncbi:MAG: hypothetical protein WAW02_03175 [Sideroxyarcus sp.]
MKKSLMLIALAITGCFAVAASAGTGAAKAGDGDKSTQGGKQSNNLDALQFGHSKAIPIDTQMVNNGKVLEVLDTDMYTYLQVTTEKGPLWIAAYKTNITKGAIVKFSNGVAMSNFHSNALDRSFDVIVFVDSVEQVK